MSQIPASDALLAFPDGVGVAQIRIARPTSRLDEVTAFYRDGLGLPVIGSFVDHAGYDGVMLGLPGRVYHLEFTQHASGSPCPAPSQDNLLVLYVPDAGHRRRIHARFDAMGVSPIEPENPYWADKSRTYADPDGWRVVVCSVTGV